jgi:hypothetical protein
VRSLQYLMDTILSRIRIQLTHVAVELRCSTSFPAANLFAPSTAPISEEHLDAFAAAAAAIGVPDPVTTALSEALLRASTTISNSGAPVPPAEPRATDAPPQRAAGATRDGNFATSVHAAPSAPSVQSRPGPDATTTLTLRLELGRAVILDTTAASASSAVSDFAFLFHAQLYSDALSSLFRPALQPSALIYRNQVCPTARLVHFPRRHGE